MLKPMFNLPHGVVGARAEGLLSTSDFRDVLEPLVENVRMRRLPTRLLIEIGPAFRDVEGGERWRTLKEGLGFLQPLDRCAFLGGEPWVRAAARLAGAFLACDLKTYPERHREAAISWLLREGDDGVEAPNLRIRPEQNTLVVELRDRLCREDLDSIREISRMWTRVGGRLQALVFHGARFPGWENPESLDSHWIYLRDELVGLRRVAVVTSGPLGAHFAFIGKDIVDAEIRAFRPNQLYEAMGWAGEIATWPGRVESTPEGEPRLRRPYA